MKRHCMVAALFLRKVHHKTSWKHNQDAVFWIKIVQSTGSRIAILENEVICNHHRWHCARRLHSPSDFSKRRSSIIREARDTKASSQGYAEEQSACAAAATAATAYSQGRRKKHLERGCDLGKRRSARRNEKTARKWKWPLETVSEPLHKWTLVLI